MVWPPSARGLLVTEGVRGDGGVLLNRDGNASCSTTSPPFFAAETADTIEEADQWYDNKKDFRRPPELLPRDEVAPGDQLRGEGGTRAARTAGSTSTSPAAGRPTTSAGGCPRCTTSSRSSPTSTSPTSPMEVGPTCHYIMGGVRVEADTDGYDRGRAVRRGRGRRRHARREPARRQLAVGPDRLRPPGRPSRRPSAPSECR